LPWRASRCSSRARSRAAPDDPFRVDAEALIALTPQELASGFQVGPQNPLLGIEGRARLLNRLGRVVAEHPETFGRADSPRPGGLFDVLAAKAQGGIVSAPDILGAILLHLGAIWPGRITLGGLELGDTWRYPLAARAPGAADETDDLVPFHKLSQWLAYSLIEPLTWAGIAVAEVDGLTGLPEYRNGGLFLDAGVIALKHPADADRAHEVGSRLVVEWRALTGRAPRPHRAARSNEARPVGRRASARQGSGRRHLGNRPPPCPREAAGRFAAAHGDQRRDGVLALSRRGAPV
jgi:hypothetical protein